MSYVKAKIESTSITVTDCGVTVFDLTISGDGFRQKFGGALDNAPLQLIFTICGVEQWEDIPGSEVFVDVLDGKVIGISDNPDGNFRFGYPTHCVGTEILGED